MRKNILLIMSDQQRLDSISAYGGSICRTPHIDGLARDGMKFNNAFTPAAICSPARASIMTGVFPNRHGVVDNFSNIREGVPTLTDYLSSEDYFRGYAGKWHIDETKSPCDHGFVGKPFMGYGFPGSNLLEGLAFMAPPINIPNYYETYLKEHGYDLPNVTQGFFGINPSIKQEMFAKHEGALETCIEYFVAHETMALMTQAKEEDKPFFIWANFWGPHSPSLIPEPYFSMYNPEDIEEHPSFRDSLDHKPNGQKYIRKMWGLDEYTWQEGFGQIAARYFGHCTLIDDMVGLMLDKLDAMGELENTVIVYVADHGDCLGAHGLIEKGSFPYDEIYRVPLIVKGLGTKDNDSLVYSHEIMPSLVELAGKKLTQPVDGESLLPLMTNEIEDNNREHFFFMFDKLFYNADQRIIRTKHHTFVFNPGDIGELYDLERDPYQLSNEIDNPDYKSIKEELMRLMLQEMKAQKDPVLKWFEAIRHRY